MRLSALTAFAGFIMVLVGLWCPILRPFHLYNMNAYDGNKPYAIVILLVGVIGILSTFFNRAQLIRITAWLSLVLVALFYLLAFLKVHTTFSFIPFHSLDAFLTRQIKFKWGWHVLFGGALLAVVGGVVSSNKLIKLD